MSGRPRGIDAGRVLRLAAGRSAAWPAAEECGAWRELASRSRALRLAPLLHYRLVESRRSAPAAAREALRLAYLAALARGEIQSSATADVLGALAAAGIMPIVVKGADLARRVYPRPELRPMVDVDLVVEERELEGSERALSGIGFAPARERTGRLVAREVELERGAVRIEVRGAFAQYPRWGDVFPMDAAAMRARAVPAELLGRPIRRLEDADHLLYLLYHLGIVHLFRGPRWILDLDRLIESASPAIDWGAFEARARAWGLIGAAHLGLEMATGILGSAVPAEVLARLARGSRGAALFGRVAGPGSLRAELGRFLLARRPGSALAALARALFPEREWLDYRWGPAPGRSYLAAWLRHVRGACAGG